MVDAVAELLLQLLAQHEFQHIEVVVLLVADHVNHLLRFELFVTQLGGAQVLRHIHGGAVFAEQHFLVQSFVGEVYAHGAVFMAIEHAFIESLLHQRFAQQVGVGFVVGLVEMDTQTLVGGIETSIHPLVHGLPQLAHFFVAGFPLAEHLASFQHNGGLLCSLIF